MWFLGNSQEGTRNNGGVKITALTYLCNCSLPWWSCHKKARRTLTKRLKCVLFCLFDAYRLCLDMTSYWFWKWWMWAELLLDYSWKNWTGAFTFSDNSEDCWCCFFLHVRLLLLSYQSQHNPSLHSAAQYPPGEKQIQGTVFVSVQVRSNHIKTL